MSSDQARLGHFKTAREIRDEDQPEWEPYDADQETDTGTRERCSCGATVSKQFARVFGDNDDNIDECPACATYREIAHTDSVGSGVGPI